MKTKDELKKIANDIYLEVKNHVKSYGMLSSLTEYGQIKKEAENLYLELRTKYNLSDEENHRVDHLFARASVLHSGKEWRRRKKEGDE